MFFFGSSEDKRGILLEEGDGVRKEGLLLLFEFAFRQVSSTGSDLFESGLFFVNGSDDDEFREQVTDGSEQFSAVDDLKSKSILFC